MKNQNPEQAYLEYWENPDLKKHPCYQQWRDYELAGVERGKQFAQMTSRHTSLPGKRVLDNGSGDGGLSIAFAQGGAKVYAIEPDPERVYRSNLRFRGYDLDIRLFRGKAENLPFPAGHFDVIVACDMIEHVHNAKQALKEMNRVLKPSGILFMTAPNRLSWANFRSDPHFGMVGISILPHFLASWYVTKVRKETTHYYVGVFPLYTRILRRLTRLGLNVIETNFHLFSPEKPVPATGQQTGFIKTALRNLFYFFKLQKAANYLLNLSYNFREFFWLFARKKQPRHAENNPSKTSE